MRLRLLLIAVPLVIFTLLATGTTALAAPHLEQAPKASTIANAYENVGSQKVAVPSYFDPGSLWTQMEGGAPTVGLAIINPDSGPGASKDQSYASQVTSTEAKGITVVGYVSTSYAGTQDTTRTLAAAKKDIETYYRWYPNIGGIFVDEVSTDCVARNTYYKPLYDYIHNRGGKVVLNPGTDTSECYMSAGDIIVNFEDVYSNYVNWTPTSWVSKYPASRFWQIVYSTSQANMPEAIALSKTRNAGWIYVTDDGLDNPYDTLPSYWNNELSLASRA